MMTSRSAPVQLQPPVAVPSRPRAVNIALWVVQVVVAFQFVSGGYLKLSGTPEMLALFDTVGVGQWFRYVVGGIEVAGAIGLLIPLLSGLAALGLIALLIGAAATNLFILGVSPLIPIGIAIACLLIAWGRWPQTKALVGTLKR